MGVEYRHFIVAHNPNWLPQPDTAIRLDAVLRDWSLVSSDPRIFDLTDGEMRPLPGLLPEADPGAGLALIYPEVTGTPVNTVVGGSYYEGVHERYLQRIFVVIGSDFRVHWSSEAICFTVDEPPHDGPKPIEPYEGEQHLYVYSEAYKANSTTRPPQVEIEVYAPHRSHIVWNEYCGYWRGAVVLDCGKDLPKLADGRHTLPSQAFLQQIAEAFRSSIIEVGEIY
jgi:hypothetical protein